MHHILEDRITRLVVIMAVTAGTIILTIFSLSWGVHEIFPYLYIVPIILISYLYPKRGVLSSLILGCVYMGLVYMFGFFDLVLITVSTAWFYVIVSVGVVMSSLSEGLHREERRYHGIFENSQSGLFTVNRSSLQLIEVNQQCARMLGYTIPELVGKNLSLIWPDVEQQAYVFSHISESFPQGDIEAQLLTRQGESRWILVSAALTPDRNIVCSTVDITERRQIEQALLDSEIKFRTIVEKSLAGVFVIQEGRFRYVNPRYAEIHAYRPEEMTGTLSLTEITFAEDREMVNDALQEEVPGRQSFIHYHARETTRTGEIIYVEVLGSRTVYQGMPAIMGTLLDVTDQKRADTALRQANNKLNLLSSVTRHDILNHLTAIQGYMGLAMETSNDEEVNTYLRNATMVTGKTQSLLQFTRDYQNMGLQDPEWQTLSDVVVRALPVITSPQITVHTRLEGVDVYADKLLEKVFYNLMDNTLRHSKTATEIRLYYHEEEENLVLFYEDNGIGIPDFEKTLIFKRGYGKNTGFGLFLIHDILSITGMSIRETGEPGKGARFEILVPGGNYRIRTLEPVLATAKSKA
ncbi:MAG: PAS domain-containing sensor histidine kinase [Methanomicrobiales archaeon]|nr:PAS domain-containing sensor histidine kinase [Methanomicrobiales archaeon]